MHKSVLLKEVLMNLNLAPKKVIVDCTVGCGGHAEEILKAITPGGRLIAIDWDEEAIKTARERLTVFEKNFVIVRSNFRDIKEVFERLGVDEVDGMLFDLGVSSMQIERPQRGFSFMLNGPLDMRMDQRNRVTARDLVNNLPENELTRILKDYGEERFARRIARRITFRRQKKQIDSTEELAQLVKEGMPGRFKYGRIHPATRTFQAFRIAVNGELQALEQALKYAVPRLAKKGRICVISFHSLEDRIVKHAFREMAKENRIKIITKKPLQAQEEEMRENPRARSAKMRVAEKI